MSNNKRVEEKAIEIIRDDDRCDIRNNMYCPDLISSMKVSWLLELAKQEQKDLIIEHEAGIYYGTKKNFDWDNCDVFHASVIVDMGLSKATQDLSDEMLSQLEAKHGSVQFEMRQLYIEGIDFLEVNDNSIAIRLSCGT
ncbi:hypothetical protein OAQ18_04025 [Gammaproteobacteria bacterium]|nr:hypothetical protein [Gammaproteobacteria bacterium]|tara:strand:- start:34 stop:450 length:417 start_codon:yes stop_codon:yes gene_type:complete